MLFQHKDLKVLVGLISIIFFSNAGKGSDCGNEDRFYC